MCRGGERVLERTCIYFKGDVRQYSKIRCWKDRWGLDHGQSWLSIWRFYLVFQRLQTFLKVFFHKGKLIEDPIHKIHQKNHLWLKWRQGHNFNRPKYFPSPNLINFICSRIKYFIFHAKDTHPLWARMNVICSVQL